MVVYVSKWWRGASGWRNRPDGDRRGRLCASCHGSKVAVMAKQGKKDEKKRTLAPVLQFVLGACVLGSPACNTGGLGLFCLRLQRHTCSAAYSAMASMVIGNW